MARRIRRTSLGLFAVTLLVVFAGPTWAGEREDWEPLVFRLTLAGDVDPEHTFGLAHQCDDTPECAFIHDLSFFCSGDEELRQAWGYPACEAGTYTIDYRRDAGVTVEYALLRWTGKMNADPEPERHLADSVTVPEGGITISLGYDYSSAAPTPAPLLPDSAVAADDRAPAAS